MKILFLILSIFFITGCAGSPLAISMKSPEQLKSVPDEQLCDAFASNRIDKLKNEIESRDLFTEQEWQAVKTRDIFIGMSKNALFASRRSLYLNGISNISNYGRCEIYSEFGTSLRIYIYVRGEKIVGYQIY